MTRFIHDQFAKDYLEELLKPFGKVETSVRVPAEVRQADVYFEPSIQLITELEFLGLLGQMARATAVFEPFREPVRVNEVIDCISKLGEIKKGLERKAKRNKTKLSSSAIPKLWVLTPTASANLLSGFGATPDNNWVSGIYFLAPFFRSAIVVIHQLPRRKDTIWLRLLGKGKVQKQAIDELESLSPDNPFQTNTLKLLYSLQKDLEVAQDQDEDDKELIMRLSPLYQQDREQAKQEGMRVVIENLLVVRFGSLDSELTAVIEPLLKLPPEEFTPILLQLSREELLTRFRKQN